MAPLPRLACSTWDALTVGVNTEIIIIMPPYLNKIQPYKDKYMVSNKTLKTSSPNS